MEAPTAAPRHVNTLLKKHSFACSQRGQGYVYMLLFKLLSVQPSRLVVLKSTNL